MARPAPVAASRDWRRAAGRRARSIAGELKLRGAQQRDEAQATVQRITGELADLAQTAMQKAAAVIRNGKRALSPARTPGPPRVGGPSRKGYVQGFTVPSAAPADLTRGPLRRPPGTPTGQGTCPSAGSLRPPPPRIKSASLRVLGCALRRAAAGPTTGYEPSPVKVANDTPAALWTRHHSVANRLPQAGYYPWHRRSPAPERSHSPMRSPGAGPRAATGDGVSRLAGRVSGDRRARRVRRAVGGLLPSVRRTLGPGAQAVCWLGSSQYHASGS